MRVIVTGLIGSIPLAGLTLHYLQYVLGLKSLGHEVLYLEDTGTWAYDPTTDGMVEDSSSGVAYLDRVMRKYGHESGWTFISHQGYQHGVCGKKLDDFIRSADIFINVTGAGIIRDQYAGVPSRLYIDTDPGFIQLRLANGIAQDKYHLDLHTDYFSFGCNIGAANCSIPAAGLDWKPTVQPTCIDLWPVSPGNVKAPFSTVMKWKSYSPEELEGKTYGLKDLELEKFSKLPLECHEEIELAINGEPPRDELESQGWLVRDALSVSTNITAYQKYIAASRAEWSIAKHAYVAMHSGWFSERSACYLASGRPVVVQQTGYSDWMDTSKALGVVPFKDFEEAKNGILEVTSNYKKHCIAARDIANEYFSAEKVLLNLLERI